MTILKTIKYQPKHPILKHFIKYFWVIKSDHQITVNHKLLPVSNIDFVINFSSPIKYILDSKTEIVLERFHFQGIRNQYYILNQKGKLDILGISFFPAGLYPFLKTPLSEFTNKTVELDIFVNEFASRIEEKLSVTDVIAEKLDILEKELIQLIDIKLIPTKEVNLIFNFFDSNISNIKINHFCEQYGINQRNLERTFNKYIGISPKLFFKINRFQRAVNQMLKKKPINLISLAYENEYYDQTHFIKDFKSFTGCSPSQFLNERRSIKEIIECS